jgi:hypothetical protein
MNNPEKMICVAKVFGTRRPVKRVPISVANLLIWEGWHFVRKGVYKQIYRG